MHFRIELIVAECITIFNYVVASFAN